MTDKNNIKISKIPKEDIYRSYNIDKNKLKSKKKTENKANEKKIEILENEVDDKQKKEIKQTKTPAKTTKSRKASLQDEVVIKVKVKDENDFINDQKKIYNNARKTKKDPSPTLKKVEEPKKSNKEKESIETSEPKVTEETSFQEEKVIKQEFRRLIFVLILNAILIIFIGFLLLK